VAQLAGLAGDAAGAAAQQARAAQLATAVNGVLRRSDGIYIDGVDGVDADGTQSGHASQEANALALAYGVVPAAEMAAVGDYVAGLGIDLAPNHGLELLRALAAAGMTDAMVHTLTDASIPGWAHIVAAGGTFIWEMWQPSDLIGDSMSHGWGSSALVAMQESLLGVSLMEPNPDGTVRALVAPPSAGLWRASGSVPTVAGPVAVSWQRRSGGGGARGHRAGQRVRHRLAAGDRAVERPRGRRPRRRGARGGRLLGGTRGGRLVGGERDLPLHQHVTPRPRGLSTRSPRGR